MAQAMDDYGAYYIETTRLPEALKRLERALIPPTPEILGSEFDRVATLTFADTVLKIPIYATLHPNTESGYSPEEDTFIELKIGDRDILIWTGVFATAVQTGGRIGLINGLPADLLHIRLWLDIDSHYSLITLDFLSHQLYGLTEEHERYQALHTALIEVCTYCLICRDVTGIEWGYPPIPAAYLPSEYDLTEVDPAVRELISHHSTLPPHLLDKWPVPQEVD